MSPTVDLLYVDSGGGHRAAALALRETLAERSPDWTVRLISVQDLLDPIDTVRKLTGIRSQEIYNIILRRGWTAAAGPMIPAMHTAIHLTHRDQVRVLAKHWTERQTDLVVSLIPHFNRALKDALDQACPGAPLVTILTDIADYPPHFWLERQDQYVICGSDRAVEQAHVVGLPPEKVLRASGMIVHPRFYGPSPENRRAERVRLGLDPDLPTGLALFGGEGSMDLVGIAHALNRVHSGLQLILLCGRHEQARRKLQAMPRAIPMVVEGFTTAVPHYMDLADFFLGKPGPGSISEAIVKELPVLVQLDGRTLAHERQNCDWVREQGIGLVVENGRWLEAAKKMLEPDRFNSFRARLREIENQAVFEIPSMLERILQREASRRRRQRRRFLLAPGS